MDALRAKGSLTNSSLLAALQTVDAGVVVADEANEVLRKPRGHIPVAIADDHLARLSCKERLSIGFQKRLWRA